MRVLHIITGLGLGGAEHQLVLQVRHLPIQCEVATLTNPGIVASQLRAQGVRVHELNMRGNRDIAVLPRMVRLIRRRRYDIVHTHLYRAGIYGRIAARLARVSAVVATEHSLGEHSIEGRPKTPGVRRLYLVTERLGSTTIAVSDAVEARLRRWGVPSSRISIIPNAIDASAFAFDMQRRIEARRLLGLAREDFVVGAVGRLVPSKRFDLLIKAFAKNRQGRLLIVGDGSQRGTLQRIAEELDVSSRVIFAGPRNDVPELLSAIDVFAAPSTEETFGLGVLEALASGLPVLYTTCPAIDALAPCAAPGAQRVEPNLAAWRDALARSFRNGQRRLPSPHAVQHYDIAGTTTELMRLYRKQITG